MSPQRFVVIDGFCYFVSVIVVVVAFFHTILRRVPPSFPGSSECPDPAAPPLHSSPQRFVFSDLKKKKLFHFVSVVAADATATFCRLF